jgi:uncharacterized DUF497 family protein
MLIEWDPAKDAKNVERRGISFAIANGVNWDAALIAEDTRRDYEERRFFALAPADGVLYAIVFTPRANAMRIISVRRASRKERNLYATQTESSSD